MILPECPRCTMPMIHRELHRKVAGTVRWWECQTCNVKSPDVTPEEDTIDNARAWALNERRKWCERNH